MKHKNVLKLTQIFLFFIIFTILQSFSFNSVDTLVINETVNQRVDKIEKNIKEFIKELQKVKNKVKFNKIQNNKYNILINRINKFAKEVEQYKSSEDYKTKKDEIVNNTGKITQQYKKLKNDVNLFINQITIDQAKNKLTSKKFKNNINNNLKEKIIYRIPFWYNLIIIFLVIGEIILFYFMYKINSGNQFDFLLTKMDRIEHELKDYLLKIVNKNKIFESQIKEIQYKLQSKYYENLKNDIQNNRKEISQLKEKLNKNSNEKEKNIKKINSSINISSSVQQSTYSIADAYNKAQLSRTDKKRFSNGLITCSLKNAESILLHKSDEPPIFIQDNNGYFMVSPINGEKGEMVVIFGIPINDRSKLELIKTAFEINRSLNLEFPIKINKPATVRRMGEQWVLLKKGELTIQAPSSASGW